MSNTFNLTNQQQLWIMDKVKNRQLSLDDAERAAAMMASGQGENLMKETEKVFRKDSEKVIRKDSEKVVRRNSEKKEVMNAHFAFTFGVIRFPYGFKVGNGIKNSMQIDFRKQNIYFMDKITIHVIIPFSDVIECSSDEYTFGIKLQTKHSKFKFFTNTDHKVEIERLISLIIQRNEFARARPQFSSPPAEIDTPRISQEEPSSPGMVMSVLNSRKVFKEGILEKKGNAVIVQWSKRFLRVEEREFSYYQPNNKNDPLGVVQIDSSTKIEGIQSEKGSFVITVGKRSYFFRIKNYETPERTEAERNSWMLAFREACSQKTIMKYWVKNRNSFFPQDKPYPIRSSSPPVDYDESDGVAHSRPQADIEMTIFKQPTSPVKVRFPDVPQSEHPKMKEPQNKSPIPKKESLPVPLTVGVASSPSGSAQSLSKPPSSPSRVAPPLPGPPAPPGPPPPPGPPAPPPMPGTLPKERLTLKAHCDIKLKHFFVPALTPKVVKKTIWAELSDVTQELDMKLLEEYFIESKNSGSFKTVKRASYLNPKKTQNILILMKSDLFIQTVKRLQDLISSIKAPEENEIDMIRTLQKYQPTEDEIELYQKLSTDNVQLNKADKIMSLLCSIPCLRKRLELILNLWTFESRYEEFIQFLKQLSLACNQILNSKKFPKVVEYLLSILNLMNTSGPSNVGSVTKAFHLKFISQLKNIQNANGYTLLNMLVNQLKKTRPELLDFHKELNAVMECENMSVKAVHATIEVLKSDLQSVVKNSEKVKSVIKNLTPQECEFFQSIKDFHKALNNKLHLTVNETDEIERKYNQILIWFGLPRDTSSEDIFKYLTSFLREFIETESKKLM